jgi:hypothetical protein
VSDDYLGMAMLHLNKPASNIINIIGLEGMDDDEKDIECNKVPPPSWIDIHSGFDDKAAATGQVLCSVVVARSDTVF